MIPANKAEQLILVAPVGGKDRLVVEGSYFVGGLSNKTIEFQLDYEVVSELDLGIYSSYIRNLYIKDRFIRKEVSERPK
ncbi:hypothetical protein D3C76_1763930 [compost metagenome]